MGNQHKPEKATTTYCLTPGDACANDVLSLMNIYLTEWMHRDELLWKQVFKYFYATLVVIFLPQLASFFQISLPVFPYYVYPIIGLLLSILFLYVSIGYAKRLEASGNTYLKFINLFPEELRRIPLSDPSIRGGKFFSKRMSVVICTLMFVGLSLLALIMLTYYLSPLSTNTSEPGVIDIVFILPLPALAG